MQDTSGAMAHAARARGDFEYITFGPLASIDVSGILFVRGATMVLRTVYLELSNDQFDDWLRVLCHNISYSLFVRTSGMRRRYEVSRDGSTVAEIETQPLGERLKVTTARIGVEYQSVNGAQVAIPGFIEHYNAAMLADFGVTPETGMDSGFAAWIVEPIGLDKAGLPPMVESTQRVETSAVDGQQGEPQPATIGASNSIITHDLPLLNCDVPAFITWLGWYTSNVVSRKFPTDRGYFRINPLPSPWPTTPPIAELTFIELTGRRGFDGETGSEPQEIDHWPWLIRFDIVRLGKNRIRLRAQCGESAVMSYFGELLKAIIGDFAYDPIKAQPAEASAGDIPTDKDKADWRTWPTVAYHPSSGSILQSPDKGERVIAKKIPPLDQPAAPDVGDGDGQQSIYSIEGNDFDPVEAQRRARERLAAAQAQCGEGYATVFDEDCKATRDDVYGVVERFVLRYSASQGDVFRWHVRREHGKLSIDANGLPVVVVEADRINDNASHVLVTCLGKDPDDPFHDYSQALSLSQAIRDELTRHYLRSGVENGRAATVNKSGGLDIQANTLNIYGDVAGRDMIDASDGQSNKPLSFAQRRRSRFHRGYLLAAVILAALAIIVSLILFPEWGQSVPLLVVLAVLVSLTVVAFIANSRQAFEVSPNSARHEGD